MGSLAENAVAFAVNGQLRRYFSSQENSSSFQLMQPFLTGGVTGFFSAIVLCPCDVVKCRAQLLKLSNHSSNHNNSVTHMNNVNGIDRLQSSVPIHRLKETRTPNLPNHGSSSSSSSSSSAMMDVMRATYRRQGMSGFFTGLNAQILRDIPFYLSFFGCYDTLVRLLKRECPSWSDTSITFISGGLAGQIAWVVSMPFDVIKSIIQTAEVPRSVGEVARDILRKEGLAGFTNGMGVAVVRAFPANAALFVGYEAARSLLP